MSLSVTTAPLKLLHMDVWGPAPVLSSNGFRYYVYIIDDYTKFCWVYPLSLKSEFKSTFENFKTYIENQLNLHIKIIRTDGGGEFVNHALTKVLLNSGISHEITCPHTSEQNGVVESKQKHLLEITRTFLYQANLPLEFWFDALSTANYIINILPTRSLSFSTPFQSLFHKAPDYFFP